MPLGNAKLYEFDRLLHRFAVFVGFFVALSAPTLVFIFDFNQLHTSLQFRSSVISNQVSVLAQIHGPTWTYSSHRLPELIRLGDPESRYMTRVLVVDGVGDQEILSYGAKQPFPVLARRYPIVTNNATIGYIETDGSLRPTLWKTLASLVVASCAGLALFWVFNVVPMRALHAAVMDLRQSRANLAEEVNLKRLEARRADEASRVKSNFLAHMSHEMRTPLNAIIGFSEIIKSQVFGPISERYVGYAEDIHHSGEHLLNLISQLLDLSKIENNMIDVSPTTFDIRQVIADSIKQVIGMADQKAITIHQEYPDVDDFMLFTDRGKVLQCLINILANAVKFTNQSGRIVLTVSRDSDSAQIAVRDNGIGICEAEIEKVIKPFSQVNNAHTASGTGTGLGLAITSAYLEQLGGKLTISSELDQGTEVVISFPTHLPEPESEPASE